MRITIWSWFFLSRCYYPSFYIQWAARFLSPSPTVELRHKCFSCLCPWCLPPPLHSSNPFPLKTFLSAHFSLQTLTLCVCSGINWRQCEQEVGFHVQCPRADTAHNFFWRIFLGNGRAKIWMSHYDTSTFVHIKSYLPVTQKIKS